MWFIPFIAALVIGIGMVSLHFWQQKKQSRLARSYRGRFIQLVAQLDTVTQTINQLAVHIRTIREPRLLEYYESTLRVLETLLTAVRRIPPFGSDPAALDSAFFLVRDCRGRVGRTHQAFQEALSGRPIRWDVLTGQGQGTLAHPAGCYFCSRPVISGRFSEVKVRLDGEVKQVLACKICKEELETTKKVKVLYFMRDGKPVHWAEIPDYHPSEDYWSINKREIIRKFPKLELVKSESDQGSPKPPPT
jgi:hypothetical protein